MPSRNGHVATAPTAGRPRTKPGSISHTIVTVAGEAVTRVGQALTLAEHREAFAATGAVMPAAYEATFYSLVRRGVLTAVITFMIHLTITYSSSQSTNCTLF